MTFFSAVHVRAVEYGTRIPTSYFITAGNGESDEGIPPDPYETFSYDLALLKAGIEDFNVVFYTSVLPPESYEISLDEAKGDFHHGAVLESIMARVGGYKGDTLSTGIGRVWAVDSKGVCVGGFAAEYERIYEKQKVSAEIAERDAIEKLKESLGHELKIRGLKQTGEMKFNTTSIYVTKKYGMSLSAICFVGFIFPVVEKSHKIK